MSTRNFKMTTEAQHQTPRELRIRSLLFQMKQLALYSSIYNTHTHVFSPMSLEVDTTKQYALGEYEGNLKGDKRHGRGELRYNPVGYYFPKRYEGDWEDDKIQGKGVMEYNDESVYSGFWENGIRHGEGEMQYKNGDKYIGYWENDRRVGQGLMIFQNANEYEGVWKSDKMSDGTYTNKSEDWSFRGTFEGEYPKAGTLTYRDNERFLEIHSQSWQKVSVCEHKPRSVDEQIPETQKTPTSKGESPLRRLFNKIHAGAVNIYDEIDLYIERIEDRHYEPRFPPFRK